MVDPIKLKRYMKERKLVPLMDIVNHFRAEQSVVEPVIELWIKKGKVIRKAGDGACKGCCKCDPATIEFYEWLD